MRNKPILKNKHKFLHKVIAGSISMFLSVGTCFGFVGCSTQSAEGPSSRPDNLTPPYSGITQDDLTFPGEIENQSISFEDFMKDYSDLAVSFANQYIKDKLTDNKTPLSETWGFHANTEDELTSVSFTYVYSIDETTRGVDVSNYTFTNPIDLDIILQGTVCADDVKGDPTSEEAFNFDAKQLFFNADFASAICNYVNDGEGATYFKEIGAKSARIRTFQVAVEKRSAIKVYTLKVVGDTNEEVLQNLNISYNHELSHTATYPIGDKQSVTIVQSTYQAEEFAPENVDEAVKDFNMEISTALDTYFLDKAGKASYSREFDPNKLISYSWDIGHGDTISEIKFISNYNNGDLDHRFTVSKIELQTPINTKDLKGNNIAEIFQNASQNAKVSREYFFSYDSTIVGTRNDLVNAIFEAYGMSKECPEGATRYYIDQLSSVDSTLKSEIRQFKVVQISESEIHEFVIRIKASSTDEEFITKLSNKDNYLIFEEKTYLMTGVKITGEVTVENTAPEVKQISIENFEENNNNKEACM